MTENEKTTISIPASPATGRFNAIRKELENQKNIIQNLCKNFS